MGCSTVARGARGRARSGRRCCARASEQRRHRRRGSAHRGWRRACPGSVSRPSARRTSSGLALYDGSGTAPPVSCTRPDTRWRPVRPALSPVAGLPGAGVARSAGARCRARARAMPTPWPRLTECCSSCVARRRRAARERREALMSLAAEHGSRSRRAAATAPRLGARRGPGRWRQGVARAAAGPRGWRASGVRAQRCRTSWACWPKLIARWATARSAGPAGRRAGSSSVPGSGASRPSCTGSTASCCSAPRPTARRRPRPASSRRSRPPAAQGASSGSCAPRLAWPAVGARGAREGPRPARAGLRLVHRGLRHRRPQGRQGAARRAGIDLREQLVIF